MREVMLEDEQRAYLARAEALTFELMRKYGITSRPGARPANVILLVAELNELLLDEFPQFPRSYVTVAFVASPSHPGERWAIEFRAFERGVEYWRETIHSA